MIGVSSSGRSFNALAKYLEAGRSGQEFDRVAWIAARNLPTQDPELAAKIMRATAAEHTRLRQPVYHLALSFDPHDAVDRATMERVADRVLAALQLEGYQVLIVAHRDREHSHMHLLVNRVHPETSQVWDRWKDYLVIQQVLREEEQALGLRQVPGNLTREHATEATSQNIGADVGGETPGSPTRAQIDSRPVGRKGRAPSSPEETEQLTREYMQASREAEAARTRAARLGVAAQRVRKTERAFDEVLSAVYRDPEQARAAFLSYADAHGVTAAVRAMRDEPDQFGTLVATGRQRAFGLRRAGDDAPARAAALRAASDGRDHCEALAAFGHEAAESRVRRLESTFERELGALYIAPEAARAAYGQLLRREGLDSAVRVMLQRPESLGELRLAGRGTSIEQLERVQSAATAGRAAWEARAALSANGLGRRESWIDLEPALAQQEVEITSRRDHALRARPRGFAPSPDVERLVARGARAVAPSEARRIDAALTAPDRLLTGKLRRAIRDTVLGRDEGRER